MDNPDEKRAGDKKPQADQSQRKETRPTPKEDSVREFEEYLMDIGIRI